MPRPKPIYQRLRILLNERAYQSKLVRNVGDHDWAILYWRVGTPVQLITPTDSVVDQHWLDEPVIPGGPLK